MGGLATREWAEYDNKKRFGNKEKVTEGTTRY